MLEIAIASQMLIAQISDSHISLAPTIEAHRSGWMEQCVKSINELSPLPDAVIHTGDLTNTGQPKEFARAFAILSKLKSPLYSVAGNRDERSVLRNILSDSDYFSSANQFVQYSVMSRDIRLLALDTVAVGDTKGSYCELRMACLRRMLQQNTEPTAVFMHHPPFPIPKTTDSHSFQFESHEIARQLIDTLNSYGNVIGVFCGHSHRMAITTLGSIPASTTPSVALDLRKGDYPPKHAGRPLYHLHSYGEGTGFTSEIRAA